MIIVRVTGGIGNQLFQYAIGRSLSIKYNVELKLDISAFDSYKVHKFRLDNYNVSYKAALKNEVYKYNNDFQKILYNLSRRTGIGREYLGYYREVNYQFDPLVEKLGDDVYLEGYWQSPKYFQEIRNIIINDFKLLNKPNSINRAMVGKINNCNSVLIHIRRGDYVTNSNANSFHGICGLDYYARSIKLMNTLVDNPHYFVFSDDPEWARDNLRIDGKFTLVSHNGADAGHEDLRLMSKCRNFIIANSTFSWWAAWLSVAKGKNVIAPLGWFNDHRINTRDLIPDGWIRQ